MKISVTNLIFNTHCIIITTNCKQSIKETTNSVDSEKLNCCDCSEKIVKWRVS